MSAVWWSLVLKGEPMCRQVVPWVASTVRQGRQECRAPSRGLPAHSCVPCPPGFWQWGYHPDASVQILPTKAQREENPILNNPQTEGFLDGLSLSIFRGGRVVSDDKMPKRKTQPWYCHPGLVSATVFFYFVFCLSSNILHKSFLGEKGVTARILAQKLTNGKLQGKKE